MQAMCGGGLAHDVRFGAFGTCAVSGNPVHEAGVLVLNIGTATRTHAMLTNSEEH